MRKAALLFRCALRRTFLILGKKRGYADWRKAEGCRDAAAKYEKHFRGDFRQVLTLIDRAVMDGGSSAALETAVA